MKKLDGSMLMLFLVLDFFIGIIRIVFGEVIFLEVK